jgi:hypothetical protein
MRKIKISNKAADCLAWFVEHPYYGDGKSFSEAILSLTEEWFSREDKNMEWTRGSFDLLKDKQKK